MLKIKPSILLADDHPGIIQKVSQLLSSDYEIAGAVSDGLSALTAAKRMQPDVIVLDITMPLLNGIQVAREIHQTGLKSRIVILSAHDDLDYVAAAFEAGAMGYVLKHRLSTDLPCAVRDALLGQVFSSLGPGTSETESDAHLTLRRRRGNARPLESPVPS